MKNFDKEKLDKIKKMAKKKKKAAETGKIVKK